MPLSRRAFLAGGVGLAMAACGAPPQPNVTGPTGSTSPLTAPSGQYSLVALFDAAGGEVALNVPQRLPFALGGSAGVLLGEAMGDASFEVTFDGVPVGEPQTVKSRSQGVPRPYYPLVLTPQQSGLHEITAHVAGERASAAFVVTPNDPPVRPGERLLNVKTPTIEHHRGVEPICTRRPRCPFHAVSLTDALREDRPVALLVASPGHCDSSLCPPALDLLIDAATRFRSVRYVHAEVYADADRVDSLADASPSEVVRRYQLTFDPSLMIARSDGTLAERLDHIFDITELDEALSRATRP